LAYPEVCAALAAAGRNHDLDDSDLVSARSAWEEFWTAARPKELTAPIERLAGQVAAQYSLRGADGVHLASALAIGEEDLVVAVFDQRPHAAATASRFAVAPAQL